MIHLKIAFFWTGGNCDKKRYNVIFIERKEKINLCIMDSVSVFNTIFHLLILGSICLMSLSI